MNVDSGKELFRSVTSFLKENNMPNFLFFSKNNLFFCRYGCPDPSNLILDYYVYLSDFEEYKGIYSKLKAHYRKVILYPQLGIIFILPQTLLLESQYALYIVKLTFLIKVSESKYDFINDDSNIFAAPVLKDVIFDASEERGNGELKNQQVTLFKVSETFEFKIHKDCLVSILESMKDVKEKKSNHFRKIRYEQNTLQEYLL
jgi:hypothetical protein